MCRGEGSGDGVRGCGRGWCGCWVVRPVSQPRVRMQLTAEASRSDAEGCENMLIGVCVGGHED